MGTLNSYGKTEQYVDVQPGDLAKADRALPKLIVAHAFVPDLDTFPAASHFGNGPFDAIELSRLSAEANQAAIVREREHYARQRAGKSLVKANS